MSIPYEKSFASYEKSKYWSSKNEINPTSVLKFSNKKAIFNCETCGHEFESIIANISNGQWCGYCNGDKLCDNMECIFCYNKSFISCEKSKYWSTKNTISPRYVLKKTHSKYLFDCNSCTHLFSASPDKVNTEIAWCQYCSNKLCDNNECTICFNLSFAIHPRSKYWSTENTIKPRDVRKCSSKKYIFNCDTCHHSFSAALNNINRDSWCPYCCVNSVLMCDSNDCKMCYDKSFASHKCIDKWSTNNVLNPRDVFKKTDKKYLFICSRCNCEYSTRLLSIVYSNSGCPYCKNKTEKILYDWLIKEYSSIKFQPKYDWCINPKTNRHLPFDFEYKNIIIELDGPQHFRQVSNWRSPTEQLELDKYKMKCAYDNKKHVIRILQKNVLSNSDNWDSKLKECIHQITSMDIPTVMYIGIDSNYFESSP